MDNPVNKRLDEDLFLAKREEVLSGWPTGKEVDLEEAIKHHRQLMGRGQNAALKFLDARSRGQVLLMPRAGVATVEENQDLLSYLEQSGSADILPLTVDSCTRNNKYEEAERAIDKSVKDGRSFLNGFPAVNHGVARTRAMIDSLSCPLHVRSATTDRRLTTEIGLAAGCTALSGGPVTAALHFARGYPLENSIRNHQYDHRLSGYYQERGVPILVSTHGLLPCALLPPSLTLAPLVLEALMIAEQGVKYIGADVTQNGNLVQDIAILRAAPDIVTEYLTKAGYPDVTVFSAISQWNGAFPPDTAKCFGLISYLTISGVWGKTDEILVKTPEQGQNLPSKESNAGALRAVRMVVNLLKDQRPFVNPDVDEETEAIKREVRSFVDKSLEIGDGDAAVGCVMAFERGFIPVPFTTNRRYNQWANVMTVRDSEGGVRFVDFGNMPLDRVSREYHREKVVQRERVDKRKVSYELLAESILSISQGTLVR